MLTHSKAASILLNERPKQMARPRSKSRDELVASAMGVFWERGFTATSIDDLVAATGVGRGAMYSDFQNKDGLYLSCLEAYRLHVAEPAIAILESGEDGLVAIEAYFDHFIGLHRKRGMPGPGCFFANAMTELAPHQSDILEAVSSHMTALSTAFFTALSKVARTEGQKISNSELQALANVLAASSQGLWSYARTLTEVGELDRCKSALLALVRARLCNV